MSSSFISWLKVVLTGKFEGGYKEGSVFKIALMSQS